MIKANKFWYDPITQNTANTRDIFSKSVQDRLVFFASAFEFQIWKILARYVPLETITMQHEVLIHPASNEFPKLTWRVDFKIESTPLYPYQPYMLIEAKGGWLKKNQAHASAFSKLLRLLYLNNRSDFNSLTIVSEKAGRLPGTNINTLSPEGLKALLTL